MACFFSQTGFAVTCSAEGLMLVHLIVSHPCPETCWIFSERPPSTFPVPPPLPLVSQVRSRLDVFKPHCCYCSSARRGLHHQPGEPSLRSTLSYICRTREVGKALQNHSVVTSICWSPVQDVAVQAEASGDLPFGWRTVGRRYPGGKPKLPR